jgi:hypothetical protein
MNPAETALQIDQRLMPGVESDLQDPPDKDPVVARIKGVMGLAFEIGHAARQDRDAGAPGFTVQPGEPVAGLEGD